MPVERANSVCITRVRFRFFRSINMAEDAKRMEVLNELTRQAQELNLGYRS